MSKHRNIGGKVQDIFEHTYGSQVPPITQAAITDLIVHHEDTLPYEDGSTARALRSELKVLKQARDTPSFFSTLPLEGLGYTTEAHAVQSSDQMRLAYGTAADLESSLKKGNCETAFSDLLRLTEWGTGAALNAQAAGSGEGEVTQRMTELQRNAAAAFKKKCLIKRRR